MDFLRVFRDTFIMIGLLIVLFIAFPFFEKWWWVTIPLGLAGMAKDWVRVFQGKPYDPLWSPRSKRKQEEQDRQDQQAQQAQQGAPYLQQPSAPFQQAGPYEQSESFGQTGVNGPRNPYEQRGSSGQNGPFMN